MGCPRTGIETRASQPRAQRKRWRGHQVSRSLWRCGPSMSNQVQGARLGWKCARTKFRVALPAWRRRHIHYQAGTTSIDARSARRLCERNSKGRPYEASSLPSEQVSSRAVPSVAVMCTRQNGWHPGCTGARSCVDMYGLDGWMDTVCHALIAADGDGVGYHLGA